MHAKKKKEKKTRFRLYDPKPFHFFYDRPVDSLTLAQTLDLPPGELAEIHAAYMGKYPIKMWSEFPAIVGGHDTPYQRVSEVLTRRHRKRRWIGWRSMCRTTID